MVVTSSMRSTRPITRATVWCTFRTILVYRQTRFTIRHHMRTAWCWWAVLTWKRCLIKLYINRTKLRSNSQGRRTARTRSSSSTRQEASNHQRAFTLLHTKTWMLRCLCSNLLQLSWYKRNRRTWPNNSIRNNSQHYSHTLKHSHRSRYSIAKASYQRNQWWWQSNRRIPTISTWVWLDKEAKRPTTQACLWLKKKQWGWNQHIHIKKVRMSSRLKRVASLTGPKHLWW